LTADRENTENSETQTLAETVSKQVRGIVEAAENSAEEILRGAELEAQEIRARASQATEQATGEAQRVRERATAQAREYVERLSGSISTLLARLDAIDGELNSLTASLRAEAERLRGELTALGDDLQGAVVATEASAPAPFEPPHTAPDVSERIARAPMGVHGSAVTADVTEPPGMHQPPVSADVIEPEPVATEAPAEAAPESAKLGDEPVREFPAAGPGPGVQAEAELPASEQPTSQDIEAARLIALNMALNGTPREETDRYLAENFELSDRASLLDEVYASVEG
jgi:vacuolar-type H+-ATPase subunit H